MSNISDDPYESSVLSCERALHLIASPTGALLWLGPYKLRKAVFHQGSNAETAGHADGGQSAMIFDGSTTRQIR